jgi:hypothetical protein
VERHVLEERVNRGQPDVTGACGDAAGFLQMIEERANQGGIQVVE